MSFDIDQFEHFLSRLAETGHSVAEGKTRGTDQEHSARQILLGMGVPELDKIRFRKDVCDYHRINSKNYHSFIGSKVSRKDGFVEQPFGSQANPDMFIVLSGVLFSISFKSAASNMIKWNSTLPKPNEIYAISPGGPTVFFLGRHLCSEEEYRTMSMMILERKDFTTGMNVRLAGSRWSFYERIDVGDYRDGKIDYAREASESDSVSDVISFVSDCLDEAALEVA